MKTFSLSYVFDHWDIRTRDIKAVSLREAKAKLRKTGKRKITSIQCTQVSGGKQ